MDPNGFNLHGSSCAKDPASRRPDRRAAAGRHRQRSQPRGAVAAPAGPLRVGAGGRQPSRAQRHPGSGAGPAASSRQAGRPGPHPCWGRTAGGRGPPPPAAFGVAPAGGWPPAAGRRPGTTGRGQSCRPRPRCHGQRPAAGRGHRRSAGAAASTGRAGGWADPVCLGTGGAASTSRHGRARQPGRADGRSPAGGRPTPSSGYGKSAGPPPNASVARSGWPACARSGR
jgi:hypothetical protein